ncbi:MAG TPA: TetR/AcrR family transcriptional regulator [Mycobacteriales bacterium]|jgi:AcrR family transcriptional regulator|nr:TetR/AcrR family transcriptional regulator [Mycobacteriales bacterium]
MDDATGEWGGQMIAEDRRAVLLAAADRVVQRDGPAASMNVIAAEAGITKPILYRHFGDKGGLYRALAARHIEELLERLRAALTTRGGLTTRTRATIDAYLASIEERPQVYRFLVHRAAVEEPGVRGQVEGFVRRFGDELATGIRSEPALGEVEPVRAQILAHAIAGMVQAAGDWWLDHPDVPRQTVVDELTALLDTGLARV